MRETERDSRVDGVRCTDPYHLPTYVEYLVHPHLSYLASQGPEVEG